VTDQEKTISRIKRLEDFARTQPASYRLRVALVAALGYAYLLTIVIVLVGIVVVGVWGMFAGNTFQPVLLKFLWIPLVLAGLVMRSMWVSIPIPDGKELSEDNAQPLLALISELREALNGPSVHHVLLSDEFNAGIVQIPRFGMFGWLQNYLIVGLPLLQALSPQEFRAVLAHEFGHLSGRHGKFSGWIYRQRESWIQILTRVHQERHYASFIFEWFLKWYAPYFNAYSFVLARAQEYEADSFAVDLAGKEVTARMLVRMELKQWTLREDLWRDFYRQADDQQNPPVDPFQQMLAGYGQPISRAKAESWISRSLRIKTGYDDTHPALAERLAGIGFDSTLLTSTQMIETLVRTNGEGNAAAYYLKDVPDDFVQSFDRLWREQIVETWRARHEFIKQARVRLSELEEKSGPLSVDEQWERAGLVGETKAVADALPLIREVLRQNPKHLGANLALGAMLIEQQDSDGLQYLEKAMQLDQSTTGEVCELIHEFYREQGRQPEAESYRARAEKYYAQLARLHEAATNLSVHDHFEPHDLDDVTLKSLQVDLAKIRGLAGAYLVRKMIDGAEPLYILAVLAGFSWKEGQSGKFIPELIDELASDLHFGKPVVFVSLDVKQYLANTITGIPNSQLYMRDAEVGAEHRH